MSFKTGLSALLRTGWLLDKGWADAHLPLIISVLKGQGSFTDLFANEKEEETEAAKEPVLVALSGYQPQAGAVYKVGYFTDLSRLPEGSIATIPIKGPMMKYGGACSYGMVDTAALIQRVANTPTVSGIIFDIDTPGGQVNGTTMLSDLVKSIKKPTIGVVDDGISASAGMWFGTSLNELYVTKMTDQVGSIGVYTTILDYKAKLEKEGIVVHEIYAPGSEDKNADFREALKGNYGPMQEDLKFLRDQFVNTVATNRFGKLRSDEWKSGKMFFAKDALRIGLIDGIKPFDQVIKRMDQMIAGSSSQKGSKNNNNTMSFKKTMSAAKASADDFKAVGAGASIEEAGILVQVSHLENIEAHLVSQESAAAKAAEDLTAANAAKTAAEGSLATANETIASQKTRIEQLEAENAKLKPQPAGEIRNTAPEADKPVVDPKAQDKKAKYRTSFDAIADKYAGK